MSYTYAGRKKVDNTLLQHDPATSQPSIDALRSGAALPSREQMGRRIDLPDVMREKMESAFGADLSAVKLYESETVADAGANAITQGNNIAFAPGVLDFTSSGGQALLGHEISHVVSQQRGQVTGVGFLNDQALEARADREGAMASAGRQVAVPTSPVSSVSAAPAAGPMQADKNEKKFKKAQNRQIKNYLAIADMKRKDPTGYTGSKEYGKALKSLNAARANEASVRDTGRDVNGDSITGVAVLDALRKRNTREGKDGTSSFDESAYYEDVDAALDATPELWNESMKLRRTLRPAYLSKVQQQQDKQLAMYRQNYEAGKSGPISPPSGAFLDELEAANKQELLWRSRVRDGKQLPESTGVRVLDMLRSGNTRKDDAGEEHLDRTGYFGDVLDLMNMMPESVVQGDRAMQERVADETGEAYSQRLMGLASMERFGADPFSLREIHQSVNGRPLDRDVRVENPITGKWETTGDPGTARWGYKKNKDSPPPKTQEQISADVGFSYARKAMQTMMASVMGQQNIVSAFDTGDDRDPDRAINNFRGLLDSSGVMDLMRYEHDALNQRMMPSALQDQRLQAELMSQDVIRAAGGAVNDPDNPASAGAKRNYMAAAIDADDMTFEKAIRDPRDPRPRDPVAAPRFRHHGMELLLQAPSSGLYPKKPRKSRL